MNQIIQRWRQSRKTANASHPKQLQNHIVHPTKLSFLSIQHISLSSIHESIYIHRYSSPNSFTKSMSFFPTRPNAIPTTCGLYWCYQCHRVVRIIASRSSTVICPSCFGQFLHEINLPRPRLRPSPFFDSPPPGSFSQYVINFNDEFARLRRLDSEDGVRRRPGRWVIFGRSDSGLREVLPVAPSPRPPPPGNAVPTAVNPGDYFGGPNLNELIDNLTTNDRPGLPPAPASAIDAMPVVHISDTHLASGSQCPVCKEEFELGEEAREMPCSHVYHPDCIGPWLRIHNSCPVCRAPLPVAGGGEVREDEGEYSRATDGDSGPNVGRQTRWNPFSMLRPSRASPSPGWDYQDRFRREEADPFCVNFSSIISFSLNHFSSSHSSGKFQASIRGGAPCFSCSTSSGELDIICGSSTKSC